MQQFSVRTSSRCEFVPITAQIRSVVRESGVEHGICVVFCPHTTAGLTVNENADPDVARDLVYILQRLVPEDDPGYRHMEGNSQSHVLASLMGCSLSLIIENGDLKLGTWQGVYLAEFDGPRTRKVYVKLISG
ncbi:MAG: secondary thiamine-phosphate synthase enzyme YjbQ [Candidatus Wallacebacter cryptica]